MGKQNNEFNQIQTKICSWAILSTLVLGLFFIFINEKAISKGLLLGACFSVINFLLLGKSIPMALGKSRSKAGLRGLLSILSRYVVLAIPLIVAMKSISFNFVAVVVGIFAVQIIILARYVIIKPLLDEE